MTVIPGIGAVASWSPPLNDEGNCVRGIGMIEKLNEIYLNFNLFHKNTAKRDLTRKAYQTVLQTIILGCNAASSGDLDTITRLHVQGIDMNRGDYDMRTPLHLASAGSHFNIVKYLVEQANADVSARDRWGAAPLDDAKDAAIIEYLKSHGAEKGLDEQPDPAEVTPQTLSDDQ